MLSWSIRMSNKRKGNEFKVHLIPVNEKRFSDPNRISELHNIIARIVLTSNKRGRPSTRCEEEVPYAA